MKFKYNLGDRILWKKTTEEGGTEHIGTIIGFTTTVNKTGTTTSYLLDGNICVTDSDILGTVTVKRALAPRVRKKKVATQTQTEMLNGKTETKDTAWESEPSTTQ